MVGGVLVVILVLRNCGVIGCLLFVLVFFLGRFGVFYL